MARIEIAIVDGEPAQKIGGQIHGVLNANGDYAVRIMRQVSSLDTATSLLIPVLPWSSAGSRELIEDLRSRQPAQPFLPVVRSEALSGVLEHAASGTQDFLVAPLHDAEIRVRVRRITDEQSQHGTTSAAQEFSLRCGLAQIIGEDPAFKDLKRRIPIVARAESPVLLTGETGTGKERFANALHAVSRRGSRPFVAVNCGAIPTELFESELFGYSRGAFTGAAANHPGLIAEAEGGTLFLDEIEALDTHCQVKLLRFLQDQAYYALGSCKARQADVWVIASTNVDLLAKAHADCSFREDLYYRLAVITLRLPPLRDRKIDIPLLADHFAHLHAAKASSQGKTFSPDAIEMLCQYRWPGNVRELENVVRQALVFAEDPRIEVSDLPICPDVLPLAALANGTFQQRKAVAIKEFEQAYVTELMRTHGGNVTRAARAANKDRRAFGRLVKKYGVRL